MTARSPVAGLVTALAVISLAMLSTSCGQSPSADAPAPAPAAAAPASPHPLDALSADELTAVVGLLEAAGHVTEDTRFPVIQLREPAKADVLAWQPGQPITRTAFALVKNGPQAFEAVVDLSAGAVTSWSEAAGQPNMMEGEILGGGEVLRQNAEFQQAMQRRGIDDLDTVLCPAVSPGYYGIAAEEGRRVGKTICFQMGSATNFWGRPIEGLTAIVDLDTFEVLDVIDTGAVPVPTAPADIDEASVGTPRDVPTPITMAQPDGVSFEVDGHQVAWQKWKFHFRLDPRVGTIVSLVRYVDGGSERSILYQGALSELIVPYMDPDVGWYYRTYMDAGEFLVGLNAVPLVPGIDCPDNAMYFDAVMADEHGSPVTKERAACLYERYAGDAAWRHWDMVTGETEVRTRRDLVLRMVSTLGNYDYTFDWSFQQDGTIRVGVGASGMEQIKAVAPRTATDDGADAARRYGRFVDEHMVAINHDHFFNFRLDLDVDGPANSFVRERLVTEKLPADSPRRSIWVIEPEIAQRESQAKSRINLERPALWRVFNPAVRGPVGYPRSYQIKPGTNVVSLLLPDDWPQRRAGFIDNHLWVTPYRTEERYAAGDYPNQAKGGDGLPAWTAADRAIADTDIVVWYTLGLHHVVRAEDWPVLPTSWTYFELKPFDFFDRNPALDLPAGGR